MLKGKVIILNGPPGSGKDTIAKRLSELTIIGITQHCEVKAPLFEQACAMSQVSREEWDER